MTAKPTRVTVRALSCDAKIIGSLVGGCKVVIRDRENGTILAQGLHLGGSGDTESIMHRPPQRGRSSFDTEGTASFQAEIPLDRPTPVEVIVEGPLAFPHAAQKASLTTWLIPGQHIDGDGLVLKLHGFLVGIMTPTPADVLCSGQKIHLQSHVHLL